MPFMLQESMLNAASAEGKEIVLSSMSEPLNDKILKSKNYKESGAIFHLHSQSIFVGKFPNMTRYGS